MNDLKKTLISFVRAKIGSSLPLEKIQQSKEDRQTFVDSVTRRRAQRRNLCRRVTGRLVFASTLKRDRPKPLPYIKVQLWDRDFGPLDDFLGEAETDAEGRFTIDYDPADAGKRDRLELKLKIIDRYFDKESLLWEEDASEGVSDERYDFGDVGVPYYEYHPEIPLPHLHTVDFGKRALDRMPQAYKVGRTAALAEIAASVYEVRIKHYTVARGRELPQLQKDYEGQTPYAPPAGPREGASADERFVYKLLNGSCPTLFTQRDGKLHVVRTWDRYEMDGQHYLPNVHLVLERDGHSLTPLSITIQERVNGATAPNSPLATPKTYRPGEPGWERAKHVFECNNYLFTQGANHLARGHFNAEQFAMAAWRNLRKSPLRALLFPHLQEVMLINVEGEAAIFGTEGLITQNSALTATSLVQSILDNADTDWWGWSPREPMGPDHQFAHVARIYWDALGEHVEAFFAQHDEQLRARWGEVRGFCDDLVAHSVPYRPPALPEGHDHLDMNEVSKPDAPRVEVDGALRTVTPFATRDEADERQLADLKQACRYAIFHATLWHSWTNDTSDSLEDSYSQYNPVDRSSSKELTDHISVNLALSQTRYGLILKNEDGDIPESLVKAIEARADRFKAAGYDPGQIRSRINI